MGAVALDYAYAVHSEVGDYAYKAYINNQEASLLQILRSGDIVKILTNASTLPKYTWIDEVKTSRAKSCLRTQRQNRIRDIEKRGAINMLAGIFGKQAKAFERFLTIKGIPTQNLWKITRDKNVLSEVIENVKQKLFGAKGFFARIRFNMIKLKTLKLEKFIVHTAKNPSEVLFDCCCHPKYGDEILGVYTNQRVVVHHKLCDKLYEEIKKGSMVVLVEWEQDKIPSFRVIVALQDKKGAIARFLTTLAQNDCNITGLSYLAHRSQFMVHCEVMFEVEKSRAKNIKDVLSNQYKIIDFENIQDAYRS